ncbi:MAG: hypothetical protein EOO09_09610 [Chitinophagaceae bacterium]|nr:MAG: hypothetical protein EOO09_09610 [Chitinophagaceae bacterium]
MIHLKLKKTLPALVAICMAQSGIAQGEPMKVDHRYAVPWWQSQLCLPDDPVKTLVGKEGMLFGDYGYRQGPRLFSFSVLFDASSPATWKSQELKTNASPMTVTIKETPDVIIREETFLEIPAPEKLYSIVRFDSRRALRNWSKPSTPADAAFNDAAEGIKGLSGEGLIEYHIKVPPGSAHKLVLGFCEGQYDSIGKREMRIAVEGGKQTDIDLAKDFGIHKPGTYSFDSKDFDNDGVLTIVISNKPGARERNSIVNGLWLFRDNVPPAADIIAGKANKTALVYAKCADVGMPERRYHILVTLTNKTGNAVNFSPVLRYAGIDSIYKKSGYVQFDEYTRLSTSGGLASVVKDSAKYFTISVPAVALKAKESKQFSVTLSRFFDPAKAYTPTVAGTRAQMLASEAWWKKNSPSSAAISVPDKGIQAMVTASIRNIFQARDIRRGAKSFHVGPTQYRGLWLADGTYLLEVGTMLGYTKDVRSCIDYLTHFQLPDGGFEMITTFHKENGLVPIMLIRHAMLTQDKKWLADNWPVIEGCLKRINYLRGIALQDSTKPYYGLLPNGNVDGGIQHGNDYSNTEYCLSGIKWAVNAAKWLGKTEQAATWEADYKNWLAFFINKARKDIRQDEKGNTYLPVMINNEQNHEAQRGQWAFAQSVYPGQLFDETPELHKWAEQTVDMLGDHLVEGEVISTGWMTGGLWSYFSSFYGHAMQWLGKTQGIPQLLYDFANHSSPTMVWREEQKPVGKGSDEVGDMPHNWASAEFIRMVVHMIQLDRGKDLHLLEAFPRQWAQAGNTTKLNGIATPFGRINFEFAVNSAGDAGKLKLTFLDNVTLPENVVVHKENWTTAGGKETIPGKKIIELNIPVN